MKDGKRQMISMLEAIVKQCLNKAAKGDSKAVALIFNLLKEGNSGGRNNLSDLVHEFRARYGGLVASDKGQLTDVGINGENGM
jgi:hypothetical protein